MKKYRLLLFFSMLMTAGSAQPPNNLIFYGGSGDGNNTSAFAIAANDIFSGSAGDGAGLGSNNAVSNLLFAGSTGDGFGNGSNNAFSNIIFLGSEGDGFGNGSNNALSNNIFLGSEGDGFASNTNSALPNNIFYGGDGDGWHAVVYPLGPLPVKLLSFTAEYAGKAHQVKWITTEEINTKHFEVQRSSNGSDFASLGNVAPLGAASQGTSYRFMVLEPLTGNNFYRLKIVDTDGSIAYSNIVLLKNAGDVQLTVYPNPAADLLYVHIPVMSTTSPINATIHDANGKMVIQSVLKPGSDNAIDVSRFPIGIYTLKAVMNDQPFVLRFMKGRL